VSVPVAIPATIPSPTQGVWQLGPLPLRAYALCILAGIVVAIWLGDRRWQERGGREGQVLDIAAWAVPFGIVGGRLYHVATSWQPYFGSGGHPVQALYIWEGGLGIWGAISLGGVGAYIGARRAGILLPPVADALAPGIVLAQAIGRWGNWFNNELYGGPTDLPWGLRIHQWDASAGHAVAGPDGQPVVLGTFHPTFLYEALWDAGTAVLLIWADRRFRLGHGRVFALYVLVYTIGRGWIEALRVDPANHILGLRLNLWTSLLVGLGALTYLIVSARLRPGRETSVVRDAEAAEEDAATSSATARWTAWVRSRPGSRNADRDADPDAARDADRDADPDAARDADRDADRNADRDTDRADDDDTSHTEGGEDAGGAGERAGAAKAAGGSGDRGPADTLP
jgi:prolipoprotein diacylglyceryl transferase